MTKHINSLINVIMKAKTESWQTNLIINWKTIVGSLSKNVTLEAIRGDTLILGVYNSSWMQEIFLLSNVLIDSINKQLEKPYVKKLRFRKIIPKTDQKKEGSRNSIEPQIKVELNHKESTALEKISNPEVSEALRKLLSRCRLIDEEKAKGNL